MLVERKRIKTADGYFKILLELFQNGNIHLDFIVAKSDDVALISRFSYHFNRQQKYRRIASTCAAGIFVPFQKSECNVQSICTVFLKGCLGRAVKLLYSLAKLRFGKDRAQAVVFEFTADYALHAGDLVEIVKAKLGGTKLLGLRHNNKVFAVSEGILEIIK